MNDINLFFLCLGCLIVGIAIGSSAHWALALAAKVKAWEQEKAAALEVDASKAAQSWARDRAMVEVAIQSAVNEASKAWTTLQANADALVAAKKSAVLAPPTPAPVTFLPPAPPPPPAGSPDVTVAVLGDGMAPSTT